MDTTARIVVGTDGSPAAATAVRYALEEAGRRSVPLRVVAAVAVPDYWSEALAVARDLPDLPDLRPAARRAAQNQVDEAVAADPALGGVDVVVDVRDVVAGSPGRALVEVAAGAELLVVGHRGRGVLGSAILGSVGLYCVLHATTPVTIVPATWSPQRARATDAHADAHAGAAT
ncbi:universal stress protein [Pseudonocardia sp. CA-107938]|uniref:universal stress protein n=1 Tax=Pseudonocardia sp. CA-107938 TaxID=3240021 RepID=UPI003D91D3CB